MSRVKYFLLFIFLFFSSSTFSQNDSCLVNIYFSFDKYELNDSAKETLIKIIKPNIKAIKIYGRTDHFGSDEYNDKLSIQRANIVSKFLIKNGLDSNQISEVTGYGKRKLINQESISLFNQLNRVVTVFWSSKNVSNSFIKDTIKRKIIVAEQIELKNAIAPKDFQNQLDSGASTIILNNLNFEKGRHVLLPSSSSVLHEVLVAMKNNPNLEIEIQGHICCLDSAEIDGIDIDTQEKALSVNRAKAVYQYLISCGIQAVRMSYKGFGAKRKLISPELNAIDAETNRRVEFKIIKK